MTDINLNTQLKLTTGLDKSLAWRQGGSVRYLVAELSAIAGETTAENAPPPALNLALCIDVSGSMAGEKIDAARRAAMAVVESLTPRDRLSIVTFESVVELLLDARPMDEAGRSAALSAISSLTDRGGTNLFDGWVLAAERVALAMEITPEASHRVLLLSDGQANHGVTDHAEIVLHVGALLERRVLTSALGIGDGYDEELLGRIAEAGGGNLHDANAGAEVSEVVLGELQHGRLALLERVALRVTVPSNMRAEVVGAWASTAMPGTLEVMVGSLQPDQNKRVVVRLHCPSGEAGTPILLPVAAVGSPPEGGEAIVASPIEVELRLARGATNTAQPRNLALCLAVVQAWQAEVLREAVRLNRARDRRAAKDYLGRQIRMIERYARGVPGTDTMLAELILVERRVGEEWDERTRKNVYTSSFKRARLEEDYRSAPQASISEQFSRSPR